LGRGCGERTSIVTRPAGRVKPPADHGDPRGVCGEVVGVDRISRFVIANNPTAPILTTDGVHINRPPVPALRPALLAYLQNWSDHI
jgi:hypothetical protein